MDIVLASGSYKRKEIMEKSRIPFRVEVPEIEEKAFKGLPIEKQVEELARAKAIKAAEKFPQDIIIAADTLSELPYRGIQGKPKNLKEAIKIALEYAGKETTAYTAVCLIHPQEGEFVETVETKVKFQDFTRQEVESLIDEQFLRRAGALGMSEGTAGYTLVESVSGSYTGAFGLPMEVVRKYLKKWEII